MMNNNFVKEPNKMFYCCNECHSKYKTQERIITHMKNKHNIIIEPGNEILVLKNTDKPAKQKIINKRNKAEVKIASPLLVEPERGEKNRMKPTKLCIGCSNNTDKTQLLPVRRDKGIICQNKHAICTDCLNKHISSYESKCFIYEEMVNDGSIKCPNELCNDRITLGMLQRIFSANQYMLVQQKYSQLTQNELEEKIKTQLEKELRTEIEDEFYNADLGSECIICYDNVKKNKGIVCNKEGLTHVICSTCLGKYISNSMDLFMNSSGSIKCCGFQCNNRISLGSLETVVSPEIYLILTDKYKKYLEKIIIPDIEAKYAQDIKNQFDNRLEHNLINYHKNLLINNVLTLRCPNKKCKQAFIDFSGCFALTCSRCRTGFCAYCLKDCGDDAHRHVANCPLNTRPRKELFGTHNHFLESQRIRREKIVYDYLKIIDEADLVKKACMQEFKDLGLNII